MSTNVPGFQSFSSFFVSFCIGKSIIVTGEIRVNSMTSPDDTYEGDLQAFRVILTDQLS